jgi:hypothetical protein
VLTAARRKQTRGPLIAIRSVNKGSYGQSML